MAMSVGKGTADGGALAAKFDHAPLTARAARVAPPRTTENSSEKREDGDDRGNQKMIIIIYKTEYARNKIFKNLRKKLNKRSN